MTPQVDLSREKTTELGRLAARAGALAVLVASVATSTACGAPPDGVASYERVGEAASAVVGGSADADYKYPWVVSVSSALTCRGVLLSPYWVLTAAHCVAYAGGTISYERTDPYTGVKETGTRSVSAYGVHIHPDYDASNNYHDIALLSVTDPFTLGPRLQSIGVPQTPDVAGTLGTLSNYSHSAVLPPGEIALFRAPMGEPSLPAFGYFDATTTTASLCPGDSGSGFVTYESGRAVVRGVASSGTVSNNNCAAPYGSARFADVFAHHDWLLGTMKTTDADLAGNTRVRRGGYTGKGVLGLGCTNPAGTLWGPLNVAGIEEAANCPAGETQAIVCSLQGAQTTTIRGFSMKTTYANGTSTTQALPFSPSFASYYGVMPEGVTREFTCSLAFPQIVLPPGGVARL